MIGITGGAGYIGLALAEKAIENGYKVKIIDKDINCKVNDKIEVIKGDLLDNNIVDDFLKGVDFIFHLAAQANARFCSDDIEKCLKLNVLSTRILLEKIKNSNLSGFLFSSSIVALYGNPEYTPLDENHPIKPLNDYGVMKRSSELFCQSYYRSFGVPIVISRQSTIYGPSPSMKYDSAIHNFILRAINNRPIVINGNGNQKRNFLWINDLIESYLSIYDNMKNNRELSGEVFNIAGPDEFTIREITRKINNISKNKTGKVSDISFTALPNEASTQELKISTNKLEEKIGIKPKTKIKDGLEKLFDYIYKENEK